jgi:aspartate/glutamate/glutamine transport system substrate-binding protein
MKKLFLILAVCLLTMPAFAEAPSQETAFDRVMRTGVIRCGYYVFPPIVMRDVNSNSMSGLSVDFMQRLAERAGLKVEWVEEITFGNWVPAMQGNRFDMICTPMWPELTHGRAVLFTEPLFYSGLSPAVRADDARFTATSRREQLNSPEYTILTQEGNATDAIGRASFPNAKFYIVSPEAGTATYYQDLINKKADAILTDRNGQHEMTKNGQTIRLVDPSNPIKLQSFPLVVNRGETELRDFLNLAITEMDYSGDLDRVLRKWESEPGLTYHRRAKAFLPTD